MTSFATRVGRVEPSATIAISNLAAELRADGADVVNLSVGEPDFVTPANVIEAGKAAMDGGETGYTPSNGIAPLREAIAAKLDQAGAAYDPGEIIVTPGAKQALFEVIHTLIDEGDEVVLLDPAWVSYEAIVKLAGGVLNRIDLTPYDFQLEPALDELADRITDETAMVIVNSPSNPTGAVFTEAGLRGLGDLAIEHDVTVISDEIYERITYAGETPTVAAMDGLRDRTITINGFSKAYAMTGWRLGYMAAPRAIVDEAGKIHSHSVSCAANFVQHAGIEALTNTEDAVEDMVAEFRTRRDLVCDLLEDAGVAVGRPDGAFYIMIPVDDDDAAWCEAVIQDTHVATVPGSAFNAPGYARLSYANSQERLRTAVDRIVDVGYL